MFPRITKLLGEMCKRVRFSLVLGEGQLIYSILEYKTIKETRKSTNVYPKFLWHLTTLGVDQSESSEQGRHFERNTQGYYTQTHGSY